VVGGARPGVGGGQGWWCRGVQEGRRIRVPQPRRCFVAAPASLVVSVPATQPRPAPPTPLAQPDPRVLANGYALNHTALSVHRLSPALPGGLEDFNSKLQAAGFRLNDEGGLVKASPDGLLLQSSTVADLGPLPFVRPDGQVRAGGGEGAEGAPARRLRCSRSV
jgi:hypothetical protein